MHLLPGGPAPPEPPGRPVLTARSSLPGARRLRDRRLPGRTSWAGGSPAPPPNLPIGQVFFRVVADWLPPLARPLHFRVSASAPAFPGKASRGLSPLAVFGVGGCSGSQSATRGAEPGGWREMSGPKGGAKDGSKLGTPRLAVPGPGAAVLPGPSSWALFSQFSLRAELALTPVLTCS